MDYGTCWWSWDGDEWDWDNDNCDLGKVCSPPSYDGTFIGQVETTPCA